MAKVRFLLRKLDGELPQSIYVSFRFGRNEKLLYATPFKCSPLFWDGEHQRVRNSLYCSYADSVNSDLSNLTSDINSFIVECARKGESFTKSRLQDFLDKRFGKSLGEDFHSYFKTYIEECDKRMNNLRGGQNVTYKTKREYARTYELLLEYEKAKKVALEFEDIDQVFLQSFVFFLQRMNLATNTIAHKVISLKALMRSAVERELTTNMKWQYFHHVTEETESVALSEEELERVRKCNLCRHPHLARIRDLFLLECWTGLRYSDVIRLRKEHIKEDFIYIRQQKTDKYVTIPLHPVFREIWEKYQGLPLIISNQKFNIHIKEVCRAARINEDVIKSITKGGRKISTLHKKWELVSAHTARRSFATNLYLSGFPTVSIMKITGHRTEAAFLKYIKVTSQEHAQLLAEHWKKQQN